MLKKAILIPLILIVGVVLLFGMIWLASLCELNYSDFGSMLFLYSTILLLCALMIGGIAYVANKD